MQKVSEVDLPQPSTMPKNSSVKQPRPNWMRERLGLGGAAMGHTFDTFHTRPDLTKKEQASLLNACAKARSFLDNPRTLVFTGPNGIGKTHLASAIGNVLIERYGISGPPVMLTTFEDALGQLKRTYQPGYEGVDENWYLERWSSIPVLIFDEVGIEGREEPSPFTRRIGFGIIDSRYRAGVNRPIVMTTNKDSTELCDWITQSAVDRLFEMGEFVEMEGESWRFKNRQQT